MMTLEVQFNRPFERRPCPVGQDSLSKIIPDSDESRCSGLGFRILIRCASIRRVGIFQGCV